jgi:hypothetical protein
MMLTIERMLYAVAILMALGLILLWLARRGRAQSGLPEGRLVYIDEGGWRRPERPLLSRRLLLTGRPDYLVDQGNDVIPVEVKSGHAPPATVRLARTAVGHLLSAGGGSVQTTPSPWHHQVRRQVFPGGLRAGPTRRAAANAQPPAV